VEGAALQGQGQAKVKGLKRKCVAAWVEDMLRRITEDLKLLLQHIDMEHRDDVTYWGRSYLKILGVLTTRGFSHVR
jgi:hypothetical protein